MLRGKLSAGLTLLALLSACAQQHEDNLTKYQKPAPTDEKDLGDVVQTKKPITSKEVQELENQGYKVRAVCPKHNIIEVLGAHSGELKKYFPGSVIAKNSFVKLNDEKNRKFDFISNSDSDSETACHQVKLDIGIEKNSSGVTFSILPQLFEKEELKGSQLDWYAMGPAPVSTYQGKLIASGDTKTTLKPDVPGAYFVALKITLPSGACLYTDTFYSVTHNEKYKNIATPAPSTTQYNKLIAATRAIGGEKAWQKTQGEGQVLAVVDSGVNYNHPELSANVLLNSAEIPDNGVDDDLNGYIDDYLGYDFVYNDAYPMDDDSHGTHVASLAANANFGVAPKAKILPIKVMHNLGIGDSATIVCGLYYAVDRGATVINLSVGGRFSNERINDYKIYKAFLDYASSKNVIVVTAAGNDETNIDATPYLPASIYSDSHINVGATTLEGRPASYTNYGAKGVDVFAPGGDKAGLLWAASYFPSKAMYIAQAGTSMASPVTAGAVALLRSLNPNMTAKQIRQKITESTLKSGFKGKYSIADGMLQIDKAIESH